MNDSRNISSEAESQRTNDYENSITSNRDNQNYRMQNVICFSMIGLCNEFGWAVMISATYDIVKGLNGVSVSDSPFANLVHSNNSRECMKTSPAILLLANIVPELITKILLPFVPFHVNVNIISSCLLSIASFTIVASAQYGWQAIIGIALISICAAMGDITMLAYLVKFKDRKRFLMAHSSGGSASGVIASSIYAELINAGLNPKVTLYFMVAIPLVELVAFLFINESNATNLSASDSSSTTSLIDDGSVSSRTLTEATPITFSERRQYLPKLMKYFIPLLISHVCKCFIVQLFDVIYVPEIRLDHAAQYRFMQVVRHIGAFVGRSSLSLTMMDDVWPLNLLMVILTIHFLYEAIFMTVPIIWIIFAFVFLMGFICGCTFINVYYRITSEISPNQQVFAVCSVSIGVTLSVIIAAILNIPIHDFICKLPSHL